MSSVRTPAKAASAAAAGKKTPSDVQLAGFIAKYSPEIAAQARECLSMMRARLPGATELVYDNFNALAIGFGPSERVSEIIFSLTLYPRWISLFFMQGAGLADPQKRLKGSGTVARHIVLSDPSVLDDPAVVELMTQALQSATVPLDPARRYRLIIKSISTKQRPRRPAWTP
jgi:hypothetical protein